MVIHGSFTFVSLWNSKTAHKWRQFLIIWSLCGCALSPFLIMPFFDLEKVHISRDALGHPNVPLGPSTSQTPATIIISSVLFEGHKSNISINRIRREAFYNVSSSATLSSLSTPLPILPSISKIDEKNHSSVIWSTHLNATIPINITFDYPLPASNISTAFQQTLSSSLDSTTKSFEANNKTIATTPINLPHKPSVSDAQNLNQDSAAADGTQAAKVMKQLEEDRKMDPIDPKDKPSSKPAITPVPFLF
ncbi:unnamed protein product [Protopolystoma xenopodis]|uniref:Uncharacterized protein n=1 Tax=Protopolystoma xenopodis TaxID=117903 RepID=A0A3S5BQ88_9PLAT|nr:unnamed protein product [Protopolystoma xenopodis]